MTDEEKVESYRKTLEQIKSLIQSARTDKDALLDEILVIVEQELKL